MKEPKKSEKSSFEDFIIVEDDAVHLPKNLDEMAYESESSQVNKSSNDLEVVDDQLSKNALNEKKLEKSNAVLPQEPVCEDSKVPQDDVENVENFIEQEAKNVFEEKNVSNLTFSMEEESKNDLEHSENNNLLNNLLEKKSEFTQQNVLAEKESLQSVLKKADKELVTSDPLPKGNSQHLVQSLGLEKFNPPLDEPNEEDSFPDSVDIVSESEKVDPKIKSSQEKVLGLQSEIENQLNIDGFEVIDSQYVTPELTFDNKDASPEDLSFHTAKLSHVNKNNSSMEKHELVDAPESNINLLASAIQKNISDSNQNNLNNSVYGLGFEILPEIKDDKVNAEKFHEHEYDIKIELHDIDSSIEKLIEHANLNKELSKVEIEFEGNALDELIENECKDLKNLKKWFSHEGLKLSIYTINKEKNEEFYFIHLHMIRMESENSQVLDKLIDAALKNKAEFDIAKPRYVVGVVSVPGRWEKLKAFLPLATEKKSDHAVLYSQFSGENRGTYQDSRTGLFDIKKKIQGRFNNNVCGYTSIWLFHLTLQMIKGIHFKPTQLAANQVSQFKQDFFNQQYNVVESSNIDTITSMTGKYPKQKRLDALEDFLKELKELIPHSEDFYRKIGPASAFKTDISFEEVLDPNDIQKHNESDLVNELTFEFADGSLNPSLPANSLVKSVKKPKLNETLLKKSNDLNIENRIAPPKDNLLKSNKQIPNQPSEIPKESNVSASSIEKMSSSEMIQQNKVFDNVPSHTPQTLSDLPSKSLVKPMPQSSQLSNFNNETSEIKEDALDKKILEQLANLRESIKNAQTSVSNASNKQAQSLPPKQSVTQTSQSKLDSVSKAPQIPLSQSVIFNPKHDSNEPCSPKKDVIFPMVVNLEEPSKSPKNSVFDNLKQDLENEMQKNTVLDPTQESRQSLSKQLTAELKNLDNLIQAFEKRSRYKPLKLECETLKKELEGLINFSTESTVELRELQGQVNKLLETTAQSFKAYPQFLEKIGPSLTKCLGILLCLLIIPPVVCHYIAPHGFRGTFFQPPEKREAVQQFDAFAINFKKIFPKV